MIKAGFSYRGFKSESWHFDIVKNDNGFLVYPAIFPILFSDDLFLYGFPLKNAKFPDIFTILLFDIQLRTVNPFAYNFKFSQQGRWCFMSSNQPRQTWSNRLAYILTVAGATVGFGATWRFPYLVGEKRRRRVCVFILYRHVCYRYSDDFGGKRHRTAQRCERAGCVRRLDERRTRR